MPTQQYILLPPQGVRASATATPHTHGFLVETERSFESKTASSVVGLTVLDSIREDGPKLVELTSEARLAIKARLPGLRVVPVAYYHTLAVREMIASPVATAKSASTLTIKVTSAQTNAPIRNAFVVAFTNFANKHGAQGISNAKGDVKLALGGARKKIERLYVYPGLGYWGALRRDIDLKSGPHQATAWGCDLSRRYVEINTDYS